MAAYAEWHLQNPVCSIEVAFYERSRCLRVICIGAQGGNCSEHHEGPIHHEERGGPGPFLSPHKDNFIVDGQHIFIDH